MLEAVDYFTMQLMIMFNMPSFEEYCTIPKLEMYRRTMTLITSFEKH